jgi:hypothetical protein
MKKHNLIKIICAAMLCALLAGALVGCSLKKQETVTVYPCYFNDDVAGMDAATIGAALKEAGYRLMSTEQKNLDGNYTLYVYRMKDAEQTKVVSISEYATAEEAKQVYESEHMETVIEGGSFAINHQMWNQTDLRISNCVIMVISTLPVNAFELFGIGTARALEVPMDNSYEMYRKVESVNMASVKAAMEADGYKFYKGEFFVGEADLEFSRTLIFVSPDRDRIYAYTFTQEPKWGIPYAYKIHNNMEILLEKTEQPDHTLGIHFVGFKDGSCILCYGDSFAEIEKYFAE